MADISRPARLRRAGHVAAIIALGIGLAIGAVANDVVAMTRNGNPEVALRISSGDAIANAQLADLVLLRQLDSTGRQRAMMLARLSLRRSLLSPQALRILGFAADIDGQPAKARLLMASARKAGRRELGTSLYFIDQAVQRDDANDALQSFDIAMRTSVSGRNFLLPILANALEDVEYVRPVAEVLSRRPGWAGELAQFVVDKGVAPANYARVVALLPEAARPTPTVWQQLADLLVKRQAYREARQFVAAVEGGTLQGDDPYVFDSRFRRTTGITPFAWVYVSDPQFGSERSDTGLAFNSTGMAPAAVAGKLVFLPPGRYRIKAAAAIQTGGATAQAAWLVDCAPPGEGTVARLPIARSANSVPVETEFSISAACPVQYLRLALDGNPGRENFAGVVDSVGIERRP